MANNCRDCGQPIEWKLNPKTGKRTPFSGDVLHWTVCESETAKHIRQRSGLEAGTFPISYSRLNLYRMCPRAYKRRYIDKLPDPETAPMRLGKALHRYGEAKLKGLEIPNDLRVPVESVEDWGWLVRTFDSLTWDQTHLYGIEETMTHSWQSGNVTVALEGVLDFATDDGDVPCSTDWKSGRKALSQSELESDLEAQTHALLMLKNLPTRSKYAFQVVQLRYGGAVVRAEFTEEHLLNFEQALQQEVDVLRKDELFLPNPACTVCPPDAHPEAALAVIHPFTIEVQGGTINVALQAPRTPEEAQSLALAAHFADRLSWAAKDALRDYCDEAGPIQLGDQELGHFPKAKRIVTDMEQAVEILRSKGYVGEDLNRKLSLNFQSAKNLITEGSRKFIPELAALVQDVSASSFRFRKRSGGDDEE